VTEDSRFRDWIESEAEKAQEGIDGLPSDPSPEDLDEYERLSKKLQWLGQLRARHFPPPRPEPDPRFEELIY